MQDVINSQIGRVIAFVLTPILLPTATAGAAWAQDAIGVNLNGAELTAYVVSVAVGLAVVIATWLRNRGEYEKAVTVIRGLHEQGVAVQPPAPKV